MTSDHRVAGSSPAGCKSFLIWHLRCKGRTKFRFREFDERSGHLGRAILCPCQCRRPVSSLERVGAHASATSPLYFLRRTAFPDSTQELERYWIQVGDPALRECP